MDDPGGDRVLFVDVETLLAWAEELKGLAGLVEANREIANEMVNFGRDEGLLAARDLRDKHRAAAALAASLVAQLEWISDDLQAATEHAAKAHPSVDGHSAEALRSLLDELGPGRTTRNGGV